MKVVCLLDAEANKLFRQTKLHKLLDNFNESCYNAIKLELEDGEYSSVQSAATVARASIKRFGYRMAIRNIGGTLYLIKLE